MNINFPLIPQTPNPLIPQTPNPPNPILKHEDVAVDPIKG